MVSAEAYRRWVAAYDAASVFDPPPAAMMAVLRDQCERTLVCSTLPRSISSAHLLAPHESWEALPLFDEAAVAVPGLHLSLPVQIWTVLGRSFWLAGWRSPESLQECKIRAFLAADLLIKGAATSEVVLVGHGCMNRMIVMQLQKRGLEVCRTTGVGYWRHIVVEG